MITCMKMRAIICLSLLLLMTPPAGAFFVEEAADGVPDGYLLSGEGQEIGITLEFPSLDSLSFPSGDLLELRTDLANPAWNVILTRGGGESTLRQSSKSREMISGWELSYPASEEMSLAILLRGVVPDMAEATEISIIRIRQLDGSYELRPGNEYSISQVACPAEGVLSNTPPDPIIISPPPPDLSAFTISSRSTTPTGDLLPGDTVTLRTHLSFDRLSHTTFPQTDTLRFRSALIDAEWRISTVRDGVAAERSPSGGYYYSIPGFELSYPSRESLGLSVAVTGTVPAASGVPLLEISQCGQNGYAREGAVFTHPAKVAPVDRTPAVTPDRTPAPAPVVTVTSTPVPTETVTPLPPPPKGEIFSEGITTEAVLDLSFELIGHGTLFLKRIISLFGVDIGV